MVLTAPQKKSTRWILYIVGASTILLILWPLAHLESSPLGGSTSSRSHTEPIRNATLGVRNPSSEHEMSSLDIDQPQVQRIFAINLPNRPDKRDSITLGSSAVGFEVEFVDGVTPDDIDLKSLPYNWNKEFQLKEYGARRAHVNAMQQIVKQRLESAIIMEDDSDWDVGIKSQLQSLATSLRALQGTSDGESTASPYGDDWDIIWLGHCGVECKTDEPYFLTPNDPTVPPPHRFLPYWRDPPPLERPDHARVICTAKDAVCSLMYMISYRGAQRLLSALSANPTGIAEHIDVGAQYDVSLGRMCGSEYLKCFAPYPSLTGGYRPAGPAGKSSDIHDTDLEGKVEGPFSAGIVYSTMLNINRILQGEDLVHATWDDVAVPQICPDDITPLEGTLEGTKEASKSLAT